MFQWPSIIFDVLFITTAWIVYWDFFSPTRGGKPARFITGGILISNCSSLFNIAFIHASMVVFSVVFELVVEFTLFAITDSFWGVATKGAGKCWNLHLLLASHEHPWPFLHNVCPHDCARFCWWPWYTAWPTCWFWLCHCLSSGLWICIHWTYSSCSDGMICSSFACNVFSSYV